LNSLDRNHIRLGGKAYKVAG